MMAIRRLVRVLSVFCLMIVFLGSALAADYQSVVEKTMKSKLLEHGMSMRIATRLANENAFIGMVMLRGIEKVESKELTVRAQAVGNALGNVIGVSYLSYGEKDIPLVTAAMMNAARSGIPPQVLADMFKAMAKNDYPVTKAVSLIHDVSEVTRNSGLRDYGVGLCKNIETAAAKKRPYGDLQKQIVVAAKLQKTLNQQVLLAQAKEAENLKKKEAQALAKKTRGGNGSDGDRKSGGMSASSGFGSQPGKGGIAAASAGGSGASGKGSSSGSGSESSGNSGGASGAAGDSPGSGSSGSGSESSGNGGGASGAAGDNSGSGSSGSGSESSGNGGGASGAAGDSSGSGSSGTGSGSSGTGDTSVTK